MPGIDFSYDNANYTIMRTHTASAVAGAAQAAVPELTFRSRVACVVTQITAILGGTLSTTTLILTLLFNGSIVGLLTLEESINAVIGTFTLGSNYTMTSFTDRFEVGSGAGASAPTITVEYIYRIVPGTTFSLAAAFT